MKKLILSILLTLCLTSIGFAFEVLDENNKARTYFSNNEPQIYIKTPKNISHITLEYTKNETTYEKNYSLNPCDNSYCVSFSLINFLTSKSLPIKSGEFAISSDSQSKTIYLDADPPKFNITNHTINNKTKELKIQFNYSDNYKISKIELYDVSGSKETPIKNLTSQKSYSQKVSQIGLIKLRFKTYDTSGNINTYDEIFSINDIFEPEIEKTLLILKDDSYSLYFKISDDDLQSYRIIQKDLQIEGEIRGETYENTISLPYNEGTAKLAVYDEHSNTKTKSISLKSSISNSYEEKYSNKNIFTVKSNADKCILTKIDSRQKNTELSKSGRNFEIDLSLSRTQPYDLEFYCEDDKIREYFTREFYYDTEEPENTVLEIEQTNTGNLKLYWDSASDRQGDVKYILYKEDKDGDGDDIYDGTKTSYTDKNVNYPQEYTYYLRVLDEAGNSVRTNKISQTPQKVNINLKTSLEKDITTKENTYTFNIETENETTTHITVKNSGKTLFENTTQKSKSSHKIPLEKGINEIIIEIKDSFNNTKEESYFITYEEPLIKLKSTINNNYINNTNNNSQLEDKKVEDNQKKHLWYVIIFSLIALGIFIWYFIFNESRIRKRSMKPMQNYVGKKDVNRRHDKVLSRHIEQIRRNRKEKEDEIIKQKKKEEIKEHRKILDLEKEKMSDLQSHRTDIDFETGNLKREPKKEIPDNKTKKSFWTAFSRKPKEKIRNDPFSRYLQEQHSAKSWDSPNHYRKAYFDKLKAQEEQKKKEQEEGKKLKQLDIEEEKIKHAKPKEIKEHRKNTLSLDEYLNKRTKKRKFFFADREVDRDIRRRK